MIDILLESGYTWDDACFYIENYCGTSKLTEKEELENLIKTRSFEYE